MTPLHGAQLLHLVLEASAYLVGGRLFFASRSRADHPMTHHPGGLWVLVGAVLGAAVGSKLVFWLQFPGWVFGHLPDLRPLAAGKTLVGGLLGGLVGVELAKARVGLRDSTGDLFVVPLVAGTIVGRLGCLSAGLADYTYGNPTTLPWGIDFGDGVARHPTSLYEIVFVALAGWGFVHLRSRLPRPGDAFRLYLLSYLVFRFAVELVKPPHGGFPPALADQPTAHLYPATLTGIQIAALAGIAYYLAHFCRRIPERR